MVGPQDCFLPLYWAIPGISRRSSEPRFSGSFYIVSTVYQYLRPVRRRFAQNDSVSDSILLIMRVRIPLSMGYCQKE